jgi:antirestriction protein ArdC
MRACSPGSTRSDRNNVKDVARNSATERARVALLHITDTSRLLEVLKGDTKAIFTAASLATRAVDYLHGLQPGAKAANEPARPDATGTAAAPETRKGPR